MTTLIALDLIDPNPDNPTGRATDVAALAASISAVGVLTAVTLTPTTGGRYVLRAGARRCAAARQAGLTEIPALIRDDLTDRAHGLAATLAENVARQDLTDAEQAHAVEQLALTGDGWDVQRIAAATGLTRDRVTAARRVAALPEPARAAIAHSALSLEDAAALDEFADDPKTLAKLAEQSGSNLRYAIGDARAKKERKAQKAALRADLTAAGVTIVPCPKGLSTYWNDGAEAEHVEHLRDSDGKPVDPEQVCTRDGFAAVLRADTYGPVTADIICLHPDAHGYTRARPTRWVSAEAAETTRLADEAKQERKQELVTAAVVRRTWLRQHLAGSQKAAAAHAEIVAHTLVHLNARPADRDGLAALWCPAPKDGRWSTAKTLHRAVAMTAARLDACITDPFNHAEGAWWLDYLNTHGYDLTDVETTHLAHLRDNIAVVAERDAADRRLDQDNGDEQEDEQDDDVA